MIVRVRLKFYFVEVEPIDRIFRKADFPGRISYDDADAFVPTSVPPTFSTWGNSGIVPQCCAENQLFKATKIGLIQADAAAMETGMEFYVGLDVSLKQTAIWALSE